MVGLDLQGKRKAEKGGAQEGFPAFGTIRVHQRGEDPGHEGDGLHLGVVTHLDNLEVVAAEGHGNGPAQGDGPVHPQREEQQKRPQQSNEQVRGRPFSHQEQLVQPLGVVPFVLCRYRRGGHAPEHGIRPVRGIVRVRGVPLTHLVRHAHKAGDVALVHNFTVQHLRHKSVAQRQENGNHTQANGYILPIFLHKSGVILRSASHFWGR